ncbi:hypothetical protein BC628DRAFT_1424022 [Trametes gibbosa]|nr:hypothetical protein BC628DRAFT_1424022 [Trametes gibbosa]
MSSPQNITAPAIQARQAPLDIPGIIRGIQKALASVNKEPPKFKRLLMHAAKGPFMVPLRSTIRHALQRDPELNPEHIKILQVALVAVDMRMDHPVLAFIPTAEWNALQPPAQVSPAPCWKPSAGNKCITFTHGHRFHVLLSGINTVIKQVQDALIALYVNQTAKQPEWPAMLLPDSLLAEMSPALVHSLILEDNYIDKAELPLDTSLSHVAFILAYYHKYQDVYYSEGKYQRVTPEHPRVKGMHDLLKAKYATSPKAKYHYLLVHPITLEVLVKSTKLFPSLLDRTTKLDWIFEQGIWEAMWKLDFGADAAWPQGGPLRAVAEGLCKPGCHLSASALSLIYILVGPKAANQVFDARPKGGQVEFGRFPWWRSPDSVLLAFFGMIRGYKFAADLPHRLPPDQFSVGEVYATAHKDDLTLLNKIAGYMLHHADGLAEDHCHSLFHDSPNSPTGIFEWCKPDPKDNIGGLH